MNPDFKEFVLTALFYIVHTVIHCPFSTADNLSYGSKARKVPHSILGKTLLKRGPKAVFKACLTC